MSNLLEKLSRYGVLQRGAVKNDLPSLRRFLRQKLVRKVPKRGRVFYEVTEKALPLLEVYRRLLLHKAELGHLLTPHAKLYRALLNDLRFLDENHPLARQFQLLGDWQLKRPVVAGQIVLARERFYRAQGLS